MLFNYVILHINTGEKKHSLCGALVSLKEPRTSSEAMNFQSGFLRIDELLPDQIHIECFLIISQNLELSGLTVSDTYEIDVPAGKYCTVGCNHHALVL